MFELTTFISIWYLFFALLLFIISVIAYYSNPHKRLLLVSIAFGIFLIKGLLLCLRIIYNVIEDLSFSGLNNFLDLMIITFLIATIIKK
ncbi:MAG: hypothetical protein ACFFG0_16770 [Candidatus Thorarchaeota archaeon]